jgi:drug/metabolite transporter (DMT)-like permease
VNVWLPFALAALTIWSVQRVVTKAALVRWSTARFYRLNAVLSLLVYVPFASLRPPDPSGLPGAIGLSVLMALTFWVTTEATRRGPVGVVAPLTAVSPAITFVLAVALLGELVSAQLLLAVALAVSAAVLLAYRPTTVDAIGGWLALALASVGLQGVGAFIAKLVVTGSGPTDLLVTSALMQICVGIVLARREPLDLRGTFDVKGLFVVATLVAAAVATIGYLTALSVGPASVIVPLVATSPALGGLLGIFVLRERASRRQFVGIALGLVAAALLATD